MGTRKVGLAHDSNSHSNVDDVSENSEMSVNTQLLKRKFRGPANDVLQRFRGSQRILNYEADVYREKAREEEKKRLQLVAAEEERRLKDLEAAAERDREKAAFQKMLDEERAKRLRAEKDHLEQVVKQRELTKQYEMQRRMDAARREEEDRQRRESEELARQEQERARALAEQAEQELRQKRKEEKANRKIFERAAGAAAIPVKNLGRRTGVHVQSAPGSTASANDNVSTEEEDGELADTMTSTDTAKSVPPKQSAGPSCAICLDTITQMTATTCGHVFCKVCIEEAITAHKMCPICRARLTYHRIHPLFLDVMDN